MGTYISETELRAHLGPGATDVPDAVLSDYIDALEAEIDDRFGVLLPVSKYLEPAPHSALLLCYRKIRSIVSVVELDSGPVEGQTKTTLAASDYVLRSPTMLERLGTGANPRSYWSPWGVELTFLPLDDSAQRKLAIADVAKLEAATIGLGSTGGVTVRIGDYSESTGGGSSGGGVDAVALEKSRNAILRRLRHRKLVIA